MTARLSFFPVSNDDMTFVQTEAGHRILIDMNIRSAADDPDDDTPVVAAKLRDKPVRDAAGRRYVDALLLGHPDADHCQGLRRHFHLGPPEEWSKPADKIVIREIWSSPMVFRRASRRHVLCDDARAFTAEARRRVRVFRDTPWKVGDGDRILILLSPHHCSWHSLSHDSWSEKREDAEVSQDARSALSQARSGATIVASSNPIEDDDNDPLCIRAKREYEAIATDASGSFECVGEHPSAKSPDVMEFEVGAHGLRLTGALMTAAAVFAPGTIGRQPHSHG